MTSTKTRECNNCHKRYKTLTKENLCAFCYQEKYKKWADEFTYKGKKQK